MPNRVTINVTVRDLTHGDLRRIRSSFNRLGQDMDRAVGQRTRQNFDRLRESANRARRELLAMRGSIPDDDFFRMDDALRRAQRRLQRGFGNVGQAAFNMIRTDIRSVVDDFDRLNQAGNIRIRVDDSALRRADARLAQGLRGRNQTVRVRVDPDVNRNRWQRGLLGVLSAPVRTAGRTLGGILSDGLGQGIVQAFQTSIPVAATMLTGVLATLGAALSGLLITILGAAFNGIGVASAAMSDKIKKKWSETLEVLKEEFSQVGEPLIPVLDRGLERLQKMAEEAGPALRKSFEETAPATEIFINKIVDGFENAGKIMFQPIQDAWNVFAPVFGEEWDEFMQELGHSFKEMANLVKDHPTEIAMALDIVFEAIDLLIDTITFFGKVFVETIDVAYNAIGTLMTGFRLLLETALESFEGIINGMVSIFGKIPGIGDQLKAGQKAFREFKEDAVGKLSALEQKAFGVGSALDRMNKARKLEADIRSWQAKLAEARRDLKKTSDQKAIAKLKGDISDLKRKIGAARQELNAINGKTATTYIITYSKKYRSVHDIVKATGGVVGQAATGGARNNMTLVGEEGPELVDLPAGSHVRSNSDTRRKMGDGRMDEMAAAPTFVLKSSGRRVDDLLLEILRDAILDRGGNPVTVLGG